MTASENWARLLKNECGIGFLEGTPLFVTHRIMYQPHESFSVGLASCIGGPCRIGGRVNNEAVESQWRCLEREHNQILGAEQPFDRRTMSRASVLGMLASSEALKQSGWLSQHSDSSRSRLDLEYISSRAGKFCHS